MNKITDKKVSIYKDVFDRVGKVTTVKNALKRIKEGKNKEKIEAIRKELDDDIRNGLKSKLPAVTFSGTFSERQDDCLEEHTGLVVLDFDKYEDNMFLDLQKLELKKDPHVYAVWTSPSGNGIKALYVIADGYKHREQFESIKKRYPNVDKSGINISRLCFESYDEDLYINENAIPFTEYTIEELTYSTNNVSVAIDDETKIFQNILKWLENRNDAFVKGERNSFIFKLASACCRFGISEGTTQSLISNEFLTNDTDFSKRECIKSIESAYKRNANKFGSEQFEKNPPNTNIVTREGNIVVDPKVYEEGYEPTDVIYAQDAYDAAVDIWEKGFETAETSHIPILDDIFKWKRRQLNLLSGIGNYGKSGFMEYLMMVKSYYDGTKWAVVSPENYPPEEWYFNLAEMLIGTWLTPENKYRPPREYFDRAYEFIKEHFYYIYPSKLSLTPDFVKNKFLELIITKKVDGVLIDPFNQMSNDYGKYGGRDDKYLEVILSDFGKFARENNVYFTIIAHPHKMQLGQDGNYPCPNVFDLANGAMWSNKSDNIYIYHRPFAQSDPMNNAAEFHSKKVKKQRLFKKGKIDFTFDFKKRRFMFGNFDPLEGNQFEWRYEREVKTEETPF